MCPTQSHSLASFFCLSTALKSLFPHTNLSWEIKRIDSATKPLLLHLLNSKTVVQKYSYRRAMVTVWMTCTYAFRLSYRGELLWSKFMLNFIFSCTHLHPPLTSANEVDLNSIPYSQFPNISLFIHCSSLTLIFGWKIFYSVLSVPLYCYEMSRVNAIIWRKGEEVQNQYNAKALRIVGIILHYCVRKTRLTQERKCPSLGFLCVWNVTMDSNYKSFVLTSSVKWKEVEEKQK